MIKILTNQFCSLATSPPWQTWLYNFNTDLYRQFMTKLQASRGCGDNYAIMADLLAKIDAIPNGANKLIKFLAKQYPYVLKGQINELLEQSSDSILSSFNSGILTYPRRTVITGNQDELHKLVQSFLADKLQSDVVVIGDKAFIEYLMQADAPIAPKITPDKWQLAKWRLKNSHDKN